MINFSKISIPDLPTVFAISGGVDSMVLLDFAIKKISKKNIFVAHFNHNLRGMESDGDEEFVKNFCQKNDITFFSEKLNITQLAQQEKTSIEATARKYRYNFFVKIYKKINANQLCTAHHLDDRIETAIFNLIRGTKFSGICALRNNENYFFEDNDFFIKIIRPLLNVPKSRIMAYAKENNIFYREDSTNVDTTLQRNFLRHKILPEFEKINSEYRKSIGDFIDYVEDFSNLQKNNSIFWLSNQKEKYNFQIQKFINKNQKEVLFVFFIKDFEDLGFLSQCEILQYLYNFTNYGNIGLSKGLFDELLRFILQGKNSFGQKIIKNFCLERRGDFVFVIKK